MRRHVESTQWDKHLFLTTVGIVFGQSANHFAVRPRASSDNRTHLYIN